MRVSSRQPTNAPKLMLAIGGQAPKAIRNVDAFDFEEQRWAPIAELPNRRCRCFAIYAGNNIYFHF